MGLRATPNNNRTNPWRIESIVLWGGPIAIVGALAWRFYWFYDSSLGLPKPIRSLAQLSKRTSFDYPAGTVVVDGIEHFRMGGSDLGARVRIPSAALAKFLTQPLQRQPYEQDAQFNSKSAMTSAQMSVRISKASATPSKRMTRDQVEDENVTLYSLKLASVWKLERVRHLLWVEREEVTSGESLRLAVDLDDPQSPLVHIIYWSQ